MVITSLLKLQVGRDDVCVPWTPSCTDHVPLKLGFSNHVMNEKQKRTSFICSVLGIVYLLWGRREGGCWWDLGGGGGVICKLYEPPPSPSLPVLVNLGDAIFPIFFISEFRWNSPFSFILLASPPSLPPNSTSPPPSPPPSPQIPPVPPHPLKNERSLIRKDYSKLVIFKLFCCFNSFATLC